MTEHSLEPLDHEMTGLTLASPFDLPIPRPYKAPLLKKATPRTVKTAVRRAVGAYPTNFVTREEWGARPAKTSTSITPEQGGVAWHYEGPKTGTFEHSTCAGKVRQIQAFHMGADRGWADIAYNALVCPHGFIFEGRGLRRRSAANGTNVGNQTHYAICGLLGLGDPLTHAMTEAFKRATIWMREAGGAARSVKPHSYFKPTGCPGDLVRAEAGLWDGQVITTTYNPPPPPPPVVPPVTPPFRPHPAHEMPLTYYGNAKNVEWIVKDIQGHLNEYFHGRGIPALAVDGDFGKGTAARLGAWQKEVGLGMDAKCGPATWRVLHEKTQGQRRLANGVRF